MHRIETQPSPTNRLATVRKVYGPAYVCVLKGAAVVGYVPADQAQSLVRGLDA
jgi:hypothetical protein